MSHRGCSWDQLPETRALASDEPPHLSWTIVFATTRLHLWPAVQPPPTLALLRCGPINPVLSNAILTDQRADHGNLGQPRLKLLNCGLGEMISDSLDIDNVSERRFNNNPRLDPDWLYRRSTQDTAAAVALSSFAAALKHDCSDPAYLPFLSALYDALNDDDDEVREIRSDRNDSSAWKATNAT